MKIIKKILKFGPNSAIYSIILAGTLLLLLIPLLLLTKYAIPFFDDYGYSAPVWIHYMLGGFNPKGIISGAVKNCVTMWHTWQGTYSSIFLMGINPMIFGEQFYFPGPLFLILNLVLSLFVFTGVVIRKIAGEKSFLILGFQSGITILCVLFIYSAQQAFYWFNGGVHYVGMFSFELYFLSVLILLARGIGGHKINAGSITHSETDFVSDSTEKTENNAKSTKALIITILLTVLSVFLGFFVAGANFVTTLQTLILMVSGIILAIIRKNKRILFWIPSAITFTAGFIINISAPGNSIRAANYPNTPDAIHAILLSFPESIHFLDKFLELRALVLLLFILPLAWHLTGRILKRNEKAFPLWGFFLLAAWSYCLYAAAFTPGLYGMGEVVLSRMINVIKLTFHLLLVLNMTYFIGTLRRLLAKIPKINTFLNDTGESKKQYVSLIYLVILIVCMTMLFRIASDKIGQFSSYGAFYYLKSGEAKLFHTEYEGRVAQLKTPESDIVFRPYSIRPWFLIWTDLSSDPSAPENMELAYYYGKTSVRLE